jgi:hypothetical protein
MKMSVFICVYPCPILYEFNLAQPRAINENNLRLSA